MGHADRYPRITMRAMAVIMAFIITASAMEAPFQCTRTMSSSPFTAMDASLPESVVPKAAFSTADVNNGFVFKCDVGAPVVVRSGGVFTVPLSVESQCRSVGLMVIVDEESGEVMKMSGRAVNGGCAFDTPVSSSSPGVSETRLSVWLVVFRDSIDFDNISGVFTSGNDEGVTTGSHPNDGVARVLAASRSRSLTRTMSLTPSSTLSISVSASMVASVSGTPLPSASDSSSPSLGVSPSYSSSPSISSSLNATAISSSSLSPAVAAGIATACVTTVAVLCAVGACIALRSRGPQASKTRLPLKSNGPSYTPRSKRTGVKSGEEQEEEEEDEWGGEGGEAKESVSTGGDSRGIQPSQTHQSLPAQQLSPPPQALAPPLTAPTPVQPSQREQDLLSQLEAEKEKSKAVLQVNAKSQEQLSELVSQVTTAVIGGLNTIVSNSTAKSTPSGMEGQQSFVSPHVMMPTPALMSPPPGRMQYVMNGSVYSPAGGGMMSYQSNPMLPMVDGSVIIAHHPPAIQPPDATVASHSFPPQQQQQQQASTIAGGSGVSGASSRRSDQIRELLRDADMASVVDATHALQAELRSRHKAAAKTLHTIRRETRMLADDPGVYPAHQSDDATIVTVDTSVTSTRAIQAQSPPHHSSSRVTSRRPSSRSSAKRRKQRKGPSSVSPSPDRADSKPKGEKSGQFAKILIHKMDSSGVASKAPSEDKNPPPRRSNSASGRPYFTSHPSASSTARDKESVRASISARHTPLSPASPPSVASVASGSTYRIATPDVPLSLLPTKLAKTARDSPQRPAWVFVPDKGPYNLPQAFTGESMVVSHVSTPASTAAYSPYFTQQ